MIMVDYGCCDMQRQAGIQNRFQSNWHEAGMTLLQYFFSRNKRNVRTLQFNIKAYCLYLQVKLWGLHLLESEEKLTKTKVQNN